MVSTTVRRPWCSAARKANAAAVVVFPTPPEPQQTTMRTDGSPRIASTSSRAGWAGPAVTCFPSEAGAAAGDSSERSGADACDGKRLGEREQAFGYPAGDRVHTASEPRQFDHGPLGRGEFVAQPFFDGEPGQVGVDLGTQADDGIPVGGQARGEQAPAQFGRGGSAAGTQRQAGRVDDDGAQRDAQAG